MTITRFTEEEVDRAIYENLRLALVAANLLPDITSFVGDIAGYNATKAALPHVIDIVGVGSNISRDSKKNSFVTVNRVNRSTGDIGAGPATRFIPYTEQPSGEKKFRKIKTDPATSDLGYEIRIFTISTKYFRILSRIVHNTLGSIRRYLNAYDDQGNEIGKHFLLLSDGGTDMSTGEWLEYMYRFTAKDLWLEDEKVIRDNIVPMTSVQVSMNVVTEIDEDNLPPTDPNRLEFTPKLYNLQCEDVMIPFAVGLVWTLPYSLLFPDNCGAIIVKSVKNTAGTEFVGDINTTINNNTITKIVTITFQNPEEGYIVLGV